VIIKNSKGDWIEFSNFIIEPMDREDLFDDEDGTEHPDPYFWFRFKGIAEIDSIRYNYLSDCTILYSDHERVIEWLEELSLDVQETAIALYLEQELTSIKTEVKEGITTVEFIVWPLVREDGIACSDTQTFLWDCTEYRKVETKNSIIDDLNGMHVQIEALKTRLRNKQSEGC